MTDLNRGTYTGEFDFLIVETTGELGATTGKWTATGAACRTSARARRPTTVLE